ncbi:MAG: C40 family peptidase [Bacteroidota bacterium]
METQFGFCNLGIVPVRKEPSHQSEMVTQLLFGECFSILETASYWLRIHNAFDDYEGWISALQFQPISGETFDKMIRTHPESAADMLQLVFINDEESYLPVVLGSSLPYIAGNSFYVENIKYTYEGNIIKPEKPLRRETITDIAYLYLNAPYLWGGRSPLGIDCSGFVQMVYKICGKPLPRDAHQQANLGETLNLLEEALPGDLAFFDNEEGHIIHTGIILAGGKIIHSSGSVRIDAIDHNGIFSYRSRKYTHRLRLLKRII